MAKAKTVVGLDVHATKIVAAVLDVETGEFSRFRMIGDAAAAAGFCAGLPRPVRVAYEAGPTGYGLARELARVAWNAWSRRRGRSRGRPGIESRPTVVMPSTSSGCCWRGSCIRSGCPGPRRRRCATWSAPVSRFGSI